MQYNSDDFVFDNQMLLQVLWFGYQIGEITCPTKYFAEASSIGLRRSIRYGVGCLMTAAQFALAKNNLSRVVRFPRERGASGRPVSDAARKGSGEVRTRR